MPSPAYSPTAPGSRPQPRPHSTAADRRPRHAHPPANAPRVSGQSRAPAIKARLRLNSYARSALELLALHFCQAYQRVGNGLAMTGLKSRAGTRVNDPVGAVWRRWEPHIHTPGTAMNDNYKSASLSDFLGLVEQASPTVECLGITDYYLTRRYEEVQAAVADGRLPGVRMLFCNVELRLSIETKASKGINIHLLVSPDDPQHVAQIKRFLSKLSFRFVDEAFQCTEDDLRRLGRSNDASIDDDEAALRAGVNQFKVDFNQLRDEYEDSAWMRSNVLIAVAGSSKAAGLGPRPPATRPGPRPAGLRPARCRPGSPGGSP